MDTRQTSFWENELIFDPFLTNYALMAAMHLKVMENFNSTGAGNEIPYNNIGLDSILGAYPEMSLPMAANVVEKGVSFKSVKDGDALTYTVNLAIKNLQQKERSSLYLKQSVRDSLICLHWHSYLKIVKEYLNNHEVRYFLDRKVFSEMEKYIAIFVKKNFSPTAKIMLALKKEELDIFLRNSAI